MLHVSFKPFAIIIMVAASCAFINPAGFQANLMVQKDGGYGLKDFAKVGTPITLIVGVVVLLLFSACLRLLIGTWETTSC